MFFKQSGYKPRTNSQSSGKSGTQLATSPPKEETKTTTTTAGDQAGVSAAIAGRRRSSASGADKFAGLTGQKRNSQDTAKWAEQKPGQPGILGGMWNSFTKGS